ncbi:H/ACA ribonucleoprotein complex subunit 2-like protein [Nematostella vectensis]|uniref:H/ACA ribonucleoprotein complex subunit 2-like protein n=1 Tax=Nematostella vectensis TaxID=45351 RepID=UPI00207745F4|nr:H/ACA ribonucleoprotein complex subunit 2-like protein [Nematostella vectensis]
MAKSKDKNKEESEEKNGETRPDYDELAAAVSIIAKPLASRKLTKKLYKTVKKASKAKTLRRGVKEVVKALRKGEKGFVILAGDVSPIDVISHIPVMCEDSKIPYAYVPSKVDLGASSLTKRPTSIVLIKKHEDITEPYEECYDSIKALPLPI